MTLVRGQGRLVQRGQASETPIGPLSNKSDDEDHEDHKNPLRSNKPGISEALTGPEAPTRPESPTGSPQAPSLLVLQDLNANRYSQ